MGSESARVVDISFLRRSAPTPRIRLAALAGSLLTVLLAWSSGPPTYDILDGTEFVLSARELAVPHPSGYPLFLFVLGAASDAAGHVNPDYLFYRSVCALIAGAGFLAGAAAMRSMGTGPAGSILGSLLFFTLTPVLLQLNLVEVHGFAILLLFLAVALRRTRCGPYAYSLALFGGHAMAFFMLPAILTRRFRERWALFAALPASLLLFQPVRSTLPSLINYEEPTLQGFLRYLSTYSGYFNNLFGRAAESLLDELHPVTIGVLVSFAVLAGRPRWRLLAASLSCFVFLSFYAIADTGSMTWGILLPLVLWGSSGIDRLLGWGRATAILALVMIGASVLLGVMGAWRAGDDAADTISRDYIRGIRPGGVYITLGFNTFCTAYLLEVEDLRPDILPIDGIGCYFRQDAPVEYPIEKDGRLVYAMKAWDRPGFEPHGILFSADTSAVDWSIYDLFWIEGNVRDCNARANLADVWVIRGMQTEDPEERAVIWRVAHNWAGSSHSQGLVNERIRRYGTDPETDRLQSPDTHREPATLPDTVPDARI